MRWATPRAPRPAWPARDRRGSSRASTPARAGSSPTRSPATEGGRRLDWGRATSAPGGGARRTPDVRLAPAGLLAGGPALPAGALQHLLVLLLAHALAALLDE